jgi:hypothetical protein
VTPNVPTKSSRCHTSSCCVEVVWRKPSGSLTDSTCVEVGWRMVDRPAAEVKGQTDEA